MNIRKFAPYLVAIVVFATITVIQFSPLLKGKVIDQQDITQHRGMSKEVVDYRAAHGEEPLWTNSMFGGMPAFHVSTLYPGNWLAHIDRLFHLFVPHPGGYLFMYFFGFFILLLCLRIDPWLAIALSLAYGFSSYFFIILEVGHNSKANAIGYLAPLFGGMILLLRGRFWSGFAVTALFMALELNANHVQITYYGMMVFLLVMAAYFVRALREKKLTPFFTGLALFVLASGIGIIPNAGNLLATYEYGKYTTRGKTELTIGADLKPNKDNVTSGLDKDYAVQYSHGVGETFAVLIPNYKGGPSGLPIAYANKEALKKVDPELREDVGRMTAYFGPQGSTAGPVYIGAIVILLAFLGLLIADHPLRWPLFIATVLSMFLSWGKYFMGFSAFFLDYFPGYNKFRAVSMILVIAELTLPLLAALALDRLLRRSSKDEPITLFNRQYALRKVFFVALVVVGGFCLLSWVSPGLFNSISKPYEEEQLTDAYRRSGAGEAEINQFLPQIMANLEKARTVIFRADALRSLLFIMAAGVVMYLFLIGKIKKNVLVVILAVLFTADLWPVARRYLNNNNFVPRASFEAPPQRSAADDRILSDSSLDFRVANLSVSPFQDATTSWYHKSIGGYHGAKLKKYDELISFHLMPELNGFSNGISRVGGDPLALDSLFAGTPVLNMLNTRYFILPTRDDVAAVQNPYANGNAWFVTNLKTVANADSEMVGLYRIDTRSTALVQTKNKTSVLSEHYSGEGTVTLTSYQPNHLVYKTKSNDKQFAVFSEIWYPKGWFATLDGNELSYFCVDYLLRGAEIPAGEHTVEFKFKPAIYAMGNSIALAGSVLLLLSIGASAYMGFRKKELSFLQ